MKKIMLILILVLFSFGFTGCNSDLESSNEENANKSSELEDLDDIYVYRKFKFPIYEEIPDLTEEEDTHVRQIICKQWETNQKTSIKPEDIVIEKYLGMYNNCYILVISKINGKDTYRMMPYFSLDPVFVNIPHDVYVKYKEAEARSQALGYIWAVDNDSFFELYNGSFKAHSFSEIDTYKIVYSYFQYHANRAYDEYLKNCSDLEENEIKSKEEYVESKVKSCFEVYLDKYLG